MFVTRDAVFIIETIFKIEAVAVVLYLLIVPESPRWLLLNGYKSKGIKVYNYIAWINRCSNRIAEDAQFNILGQALKQNEKLDKTTNGFLIALEKKSVASLAEQIHIEGTEKGSTLLSAVSR